MKIDQVILKGFRNYKEATINSNNNTLIIGENDVGKTNLIYALRLMLDRSLSELDIEPSELDFHVQGGVQSENLEIIIPLRSKLSGRGVVFHFGVIFISLLVV